MNYIIAFGIVCAALLILAAIITALTTNFIVKKIYLPMRYQTMNLTTEEYFNELGMIINGEISIYERDIFENGGKYLNDNTFENYLNDICKNIEKAIPDGFYERFSYYMNERATKEFIVRTVRAYLSEKLPR